MIEVTTTITRKNPGQRDRRLATVTELLVENNPEGDVVEKALRVVADLALAQYLAGRPRPGTGTAKK